LQVVADAACVRIKAQAGANALADLAHVAMVADPVAEDAEHPFGMGSANIVVRLVTL